MNTMVKLYEKACQSQYGPACHPEQHVCLLFIATDSFSPGSLSGIPSTNYIELDTKWPAFYRRQCRYIFLNRNVLFWFRLCQNIFTARFPVCTVPVCNVPISHNQRWTSLMMHIHVCATHYGRVTHISVGKLTIIGSDNGLALDRRQSIIWTNVEKVLIGPLGTNFSEILIEIHTFSFANCAGILSGP